MNRIKSAKLLVDCVQWHPRPDPVDDKPALINRLQPCGCVLCVCDDEDRFGNIAYEIKARNP